MSGSFTTGRPRATIADLARAAGVSISTVDRVMNGRDPVRSGTSRKVLEAAEQIGFYAAGTIRQRVAATGVSGMTIGFLLQREASPFYQGLGGVLEAAGANTPGINRVVIAYMHDLNPAAVAERLLALGQQVDAVAVVTADHPRITRAIEDLKAAGVPVFALVSDLSASMRAGYVGLDSWKVGRTAAWAIAGLCRKPGKIGILVGSHRYRCQDVCEISFRSYFRENASSFQLLEPMNTLEEERLGYETTQDLLARNPDLVGLFIAGGGVEGAIAALRERDAGQHIIAVGLDLTRETRSALIDGVLEMVISHPLERLARSVIDAMTSSMARENSGEHAPQQILLPLDIATRENI